MGILQKEQYCCMNESTSLIIIIRQISLNRLLYSYIIQGVQITNSSGADIATLNGYKLSESLGDSISSHQLKPTKECSRFLPILAVYNGDRQFNK